MKIAYLSDANIPSKRANSVHVMNICQAFHEMEHEVMLFGLSHKLPGNPDIWEWYNVKPFGLALHGMEIPKLRLWLHARATVRKLHRFKPDYVFGRSLFSCYLAARAGYKVFYETHDPQSVLNKQQLSTFKKLLKLDNFKGLVVLSEALKKILLKEDIPLAPEKILAVHDGATVVPMASEEIAAYPWPASTDRVQVGYVGTISVGRGIELVMDLAGLNPDVDFHIIGGNKEDLVKIGREAQETTPNLHFHGFVSPKDAAKARKKCDVLLAPYQTNIKLKSGKNSSGYMSPLKIFEYMETGKAIISSDLPVLREVLKDGDNCLLAPPTEAEAWNGALQRLIQEAGLKEELGNRAKEQLVENYTWKIRARHILDFMEKNI